jgi:hypothetical protein
MSERITAGRVEGTYSNASARRQWIESHRYAQRCGDLTHLCVYCLVVGDKLHSMLAVLVT